LLFLSDKSRQPILAGSASYSGIRSTESLLPGHTSGELRAGILRLRALTTRVLHLAYLSKAALHGTADSQALVVSAHSATGTTDEAGILCDALAIAAGGEQRAADHGTAWIEHAEAQLTDAAK